MSFALPESSDEFMSWNWDKIEPLYSELQQRSFDTDSAAAWIMDWSDLARLVMERASRLEVMTTINTVDEAAEVQFNYFHEQIFPKARSADQILKERLLQSGVVVEGFEIPHRNMQMQAEIFRGENLPLMTEETKLGVEYQKIIGAQSVQWEGREHTLEQLRPLFLTKDRDLRERLWRSKSVRWLEDRQAINENWFSVLKLRLQMAGNADFDDYRSYAWKLNQRFDYTPADCQTFQQAILDVCVPAATRIYERYARQLGVTKVRPWDLDQDVFLLSLPALKPFEDVEKLIRVAAGIFHKVDSKLGAYFDSMRDKGLLDLANRKNKAPGGYTTTYTHRRLPFIFMNAVGLADDVDTMHHEAGHAFHVFESASLPYIQQLDVPLEFAEVASMAMELICMSYFSDYYDAADAARAGREHLEKDILFWPYMALVDAFQHWVYENPVDSTDTTCCDVEWLRLLRLYMPGVDWSGLEEMAMTGWHRKLHIHLMPFYYIEYGLAQMGAVQVWKNSLQDTPAAVQAYRHALALGGTVTLPEMYRAAGARFAFNEETMRVVVNFLEEKIAEYDLQ